MLTLRFAHKTRALLRHIWMTQRPWILLACLSMAVLVTGEILVYGHFDLRQAFVDYYANLSTELLSIALTLSVISVWSRQQARKQRDEEHEKMLLLKRLRSGDPNEKRECIEKMRANDALVDGTLHHLSLAGANFEALNLSYADMEGIDLSGTRLSQADLSNCDLHSANLTKANLTFARCNRTRLSDAKLRKANLQKTDFTNADLRYSDLTGADLRGAMLDEADLRGANLSDADASGACLELQFDGRPFSEAKFDSATTLPDGTKWLPETDLRRFTDPDHAAFWRPTPGSIRETIELPAQH